MEILNGVNFSSWSHWSVYFEAIDRYLEMYVLGVIKAEYLFRKVKTQYITFPSEFWHAYNLQEFNMQLKNLIPQLTV